MESTKTAPSPDNRERPLLLALIRAGHEYSHASRAFIRASDAWRSFAAMHPGDDGGHEEHHRVVVAARQALNGADEAYASAQRALARFNGEITIHRPAKRRPKAATIRSLRSTIAKMEAGASRTDIELNGTVERRRRSGRGDSGESAPRGRPMDTARRE